MITIAFAARRLVRLTLTGTALTGAMLTMVLPLLQNDYLLIAVTAVALTSTPSITNYHEKALLTFNHQFLQKTKNPISEALSLYRFSTVFDVSFHLFQKQMFSTR